MLKITLYSNCFMNDTYKEVFSMGSNDGHSTTSPLDIYLEDNSRKGPTFYVENAYQENSGTLIFDYDIIYRQGGATIYKNIYEFNYMKIICIEDGTEQEDELYQRFCFIEDIKLKNELVYLDYKEDIWHSYSNEITGITNSYLSKSRLLPEHYLENLNSPVVLEENYNGNDTPKLICYQGLFTQGAINKKVRFVFEIQAYLTDAQGNYTERKLYNIVLSSLLLDDKFEISYIDEILHSMIEYVSTGSFYVQDTLVHTNTNYRFEISKIYIFPEDFSLGSVINYRVPLPRYLYSIFNKDNEKVYECFTIKTLNTFETINTATLSNNYKLISLGTLNNQIKVTPNGTTLRYKLLWFSSESAGCHLYLSMLNSLYEITDDFKINYAIEPINSEKLSLLNLTRNVENQTLNNKMINSTGENIAKFGSSLPEMATGVLQMFIGNFGGGMNTVINAGKSISSATFNEQETILNAITKGKEINAPLYSSSSKVIVNNSFITSALYGICGLEIQPDNTDFVKEYINNYGFNVYTFINDFDKLKINTPTFFREIEVTEQEIYSLNYNYYKFSSIDVYGNFPRTIANKLNEILFSGVKVWFDANLEEDTYVSDIL